ncbi:MAG: serine/threonine protein kinase [Anaerolineaceae bacterium]|nr:MAG: serine/threonine protein kinase [Anaerolineaceae bacterium]
MALKSGAILRERYRIEDQLGQGGMGAVYLAYDLTLELPVAVKENLSPSPEAERQFRREAILLAGLRHNNLPRVSNHFVIGDRQYLVMDYVAGEDLHERAQQNPPTVEAVLLWADAVCDALTYLHTRDPPVIHRDIKPSNIKLQPDGTVMLVDFGIAKEATLGTTTSTGARGLTPGFSPPEQYGLQRTDPRSDQYALAATLYALLTGQPPADSFERLMDRQPLKPIREIKPDVPQVVAAAITRAMALKQEDRFPEVDTFCQALHGQVDEIIVNEVALIEIPTEVEQAFRLNWIKGRAEILEKEEKWEEALETWRLYLTLDPENPDVAKTEIERIQAAIQKLTEPIKSEIDLEAGETLGLPPRSKDFAPKVAVPLDQPGLLGRITEDVKKYSKQWRKPWLWAGIGSITLIGLAYLFAQSPLPRTISAVFVQPSLTSSMTPSPKPSQTITPTTSSTSSFDLTATAQYRATATTMIQTTEAVDSIIIPSFTIEPLTLQGGPNQWRAHTLFLTWSPDGQKIANKNGIWDANRGDQIYDFVELHDSFHSHNVLEMAWSNGGAMWATGGDQTVYIWSNFNLNVLQILWAHESEVHSIAWSPDDGTLATAGADGLVKLWDTRTWETVFVFDGHSQSVHSVVWSPDGSRLGSAGDDNYVQVWEAISGGQSFELEHSTDVDRVVWSPDGFQLASRTADGEVYVWDANERMLLYTIEIAEGDKRNSIAWSPDGTKLAAGDGNGRIWIWNAAKPTQRYELSLGGDVTCVAWSPDGTRLAAGSEWEAGVMIWDIP